MKRLKNLILILSLVAYNMAQEKSKFRPNPDWFAKMNPEDLMLSDQPGPEDSGSFQDFLIDNFDPIEVDVKEGKIPRYVPRQPIIFQNLCPYQNRTIHTSDPNYEYVPSTYQEITCAYPYHSSRFDHRKNRVCHAIHNFNCVQLYTSIFLLKRKRGTECWEPEIRNNVPVDCSCMWSKNRHGDILHAHINIDDEQK